jgi:hypothetical protein
LTLAPHAKPKPKPESEAKEVRDPPQYITHQELSDLFGFENIEAYRKNNRLRCEEQWRLADEKLERAATAAHRFAIRTVTCSLISGIGWVLNFASSI